MVRRLGSDQWIEINNDATNRYRTLTQSISELVLQSRTNDLQFKLDLAARKCFWRRGATATWNPNYDIIAIETNEPVAGRGAAAAAPTAVAFTSGPQVHLEGNALSTAIGDLGCRFENRDWPDLQSLARAGAIYFAGHGNADGWYGGITGTIVTAPSVPELQGRPVVFAGTCSTATPGAAILRTFMDRGCRVYIGAASDSYGFTPAANGNELLMHFVDALASGPDASVADLVAQARNRYIRANGLAPLMLQLEKGEARDFRPVQAHTALQWMVFGDVTAAHPRAQPSTIFSKLPFASEQTKLDPGGSLSRRFNIGPTDGLPTLFFRGQWDKDVSAGLQIDVIQNGELMHQLDWREQREFWAFTEGQAGGYWDAGTYHAFALLPLIRRADANDVTLRVTRASKPIQVGLQSAVQIWPKRHSPRLPAARLARTDASNLLWLHRGEDTGPMQKALRGIPRLQFLAQRDFGDRLAVFEFPDEPQHLLDVANFDAILIDDVGAGYRAFPRGMGARVREFVRAGGGLVMAGGADSFNGRFGFISQGGYGGTPIEDALPVKIISPDDRVEGRTTVGAMDAGHPIAAGIAEAPFPAIFGYNRVAAKPGSTVLLRTASGDPLLVLGHYGKGRVAAFMTRTNLDWGAEFKTWPNYGRFWRNLVRWVSPLEGSIYEYAP